MSHRDWFATKVGLPEQFTGDVKGVDVEVENDTVWSGHWSCGLFQIWMDAFAAHGTGETLIPRHHGMARRETDQTKGVALEVFAKEETSKKNPSSID